MSSHKVSMYFTKKIEKRKLQSSALGSEKLETEQDAREAIACFDKNTKILEPQKPEDTLVIPLVESKREILYKNLIEKSGRDSTPDNPKDDENKDTEMSLDEQAAAAIMKESIQKLGEIQNSYGNDTSASQNTIQITNEKESDGKIPTLEDFEQINVEHFGAALLRGMGWSKDQGVGKNNKRVIEIIDPSSRGGLTLTSKKMKGKNTTEGGEDSEELELKKGSQVLIEEGRNRGSYGIVECVDEDYILIRLAREERVIRDVEQNVRVVATKEYKEFSRVINKTMYDEYKAAEGKKGKESKKCEESSKVSQRKKERDKKMEKNEPKREASERNISLTKTHRRRDEEREDLTGIKNRRDEIEKIRDKIADRDNSENKAREYEKKKEIKEYKPHKKNSIKGISTIDSRPAIPWARENLRVRIIDKAYKGGKYHKEKVIVQSIDTVESCSCITGEGKVLYDLNPNHLETVIPKGLSTVVLVVKGSYKGQKARILELHKEKEKATVQLMDENSVILKLYYDDICEYISR